MTVFFATAGVLTGVALGSRFQVLSIIPAIAVGMSTIILAGHLLEEASFWPSTIGCLSFAAMVQLGYFSRSVIWLVTDNSPTRVSNTATLPTSEATS